MATSRHVRSALAHLIQMGLIAGPLLIGWGVQDLSGFFRDSMRTLLVSGILLSRLVSIALGIESNPFLKGELVSQRLPVVLDILFMPFVWGLMAWCDHRGAFVLPIAGWTRIVGIAAFACGETIRILALRELGMQYSAYITIQKDHQLIQKGIYRLIRHPFYLGQLLVVPGIALVFRSPLALVIAVVSFYFVISRIGREEQTLLQHFDQYEDYRRRSWRLLPYIY